MRKRLRSCLSVIIVQLSAVVLVAAFASSAHAYGTWSDGCIGCHGDFNSGTYVSMSDGTSWGTNLMSGHSAFMGSGTCNVCHQPLSGTPRTPVYIGHSAGVTGYETISCLGCHGRAGDKTGACVEGNTATINPANCGMGAGLRLHHANAGVSDCAGCHSDTDPVGENIAPAYYFTPDDTHPKKPVNACNAVSSPGNENKFGATGLDNDGDLLYDGADLDCQVTPEAGSLCFDGVDNDGDGNADCADAGCDGASGGAATTCGVGACTATGNHTCSGGRLVSNCTPGAPSAETCNGLDEDCDGTADDITRVDCPTTLPGVCATGTSACDRGALICIQNLQPSVETCNGLDDDCDGTVDDIVPAACTVPGQAGPCASGETACEAGTLICRQTHQPSAETPPGSDACVDGVDNDCDGAMDTADAGCQFPAETNCFDGLDENGDGRVDCADPTCANASGAVTTCGIGACAATGKEACRDGAKLDTCAPGTPAEEACNGTDDDCNGAVDEGIAPVAITCGTGPCQAAGQRACVGGRLIDECTPGLPDVEVCNNVDDDCNGTIDDIVPVVTSCGTGACASAGEFVCRDRVVVDTCTPLPAGSEGPASDPTCADGIDNDCDGAVDQADAGCVVECIPQPEVCDGIDNDCNGVLDDGIDPVAIRCGVGACLNTGARVCLNGAPADQCTPLTAGQEGPAGDVTCADGVDNDCDGSTDDADVGCEPSVTCVPSPEVCDGIDNDCDDIVDNILAKPTTCGVGACESSGQLECRNGVVVDTCVPLAPGAEQFGLSDSCNDNVDNDCDAMVDSADPGCAPPPLEQACFDGSDNDGDALVDCADPDCAGAVDGPCDSGLSGACSAGELRCIDGAAMCAQLVFPQPETCTNGLDDDCDGFTDAADPSCQTAQICHLAGARAKIAKLLTVQIEAVPAHLAHGDYFPDASGSCRLAGGEHGKRAHRTERHLRRHKRR